VSLELPSASSLGGSRTRLRRPRRGRVLALALALLSAAVLLVGLYLLFSSLQKPRLELLDPFVGDSGEEISLEGRNFGPTRGDSWVDVDGMIPTTSSYKSWSDTRIRLRLPASFDSGLIHVVTRQGRSNPQLFMNRSRLPVLAMSERAGRTPYIASISPEEAPIGSLLVLSGLGFGAGRDNSEIRFSWASDNEGGKPAGDLAPPTTVTPSDSDLGYELWSDNELRVRVPDGAISGSVYVASDRGRSNAVFFHVQAGSGSKRYFAGTSYSISQTVSISKIKAKGEAELYLWTPLPARSSSQRIVKLLGQEPEPMVGDYRGTALFRLADLASGKERSVRQSFLVQVFAVEARGDPFGASNRPQNPPALMAAYCSADELVPASDPAVQELAKKILRGERSSWYAVRLVWDWLRANLAWTEGHDHASVLEALKDGRADSYSYAIIACALLRAAGLPCIPVAGYLVDLNRRAVRHYWAEVYLYGIGWLPLDPVLGSGASPGGMAAPWEDRSRYFGGLDERHIAFSRGFSALAPLSPTGRRVSKERRWSFQSFYEEASGSIDAYSSYWGDIELTGMY
jgi:transglutaminase-like putative cysteine protease